MTSQPKPIVAIVGAITKQTGIPKLVIGVNICFVQHPIVVVANDYVRPLAVAFVTDCREYILVGAENTSPSPLWPLRRKAD
jgi:hypothetical protein